MNARRRGPCLEALHAIIPLVALTVGAPAKALDPPHDSATPAFGTQACETCHIAHNAMGTLFSPGRAGGAGDPVENLCRSCHQAGGPATEVEDHTCSAGQGTCRFTFGPGTATYVTCTNCHDPHLQDQNRLHGSTLGKFIRDPAAAPSGSLPHVVFTAETGPNSFADGDSTLDGICEVCHTQTAYHRNDSSGDHSHMAGQNCASCHTHQNGFRSPVQVTSTGGAGRTRGP